MSIKARARPVATVVSLMAALACSTAMAGSGAIPSDQDSYPEGVAAIPALVSQCLPCHGPNGQSPYDDWPSLAGQKKTYLIQQLQHFQSGERSHPMMLPVVADLTEADMEVVADYLSAQPPAQPRHTSTTIAAPTAALPCLVCHDCLRPRRGRRTPL